jgi:hypothetical protein
MKRVEIKYLLPRNALQTILPPLIPFYSVLEIDGHRIFQYENKYLDTKSFDFYLMHHNGKLNRYKIRYRHYQDTGERYLELKQKNNKKITWKDRILLGSNAATDECIEALISKPFGGHYVTLIDSLLCSYSRIALADEKRGERLTLDWDLSFEAPNRKIVKRFDYVLIAEIKQENKKQASPFIDLMRRFRYNPISFSKYCIGSASIYGSRLKSNRFKETLLRLKNHAR